MDPAGRADRPRRCGGQEGAVVLTPTLLCSDTALATYGETWQQKAPGLATVVLPRDRRLTAEEIDRIELAVFTADLWTDQRGPSFMKVLLQAPNARWLHMFSAGVDDPVFTELRRRGVRLTHSAGSSARPIAHSVMMHVVAMCRAGRRFAIAQSDHEWAERDVADVEGRTMGVVGLGGIGGEVARLAQHYGIRVIGLRRTPTGHEPCETWPATRLHDLLAVIDDLVLTAPLTDETRNLIGAHELSLLRPGAHLVNVGRGALIDEPALIAALQSGHVGAAALDVFAVEPLPTDSPLWDLPNVTITPHSAGSTPLAARRAAEIFADNLGRYVRGEPLRNEVD